MCPYEWKILDSDNKLETKKQIPGKQKNHFVAQIATFFNSLWKSIDWKLGYNRLQIISFVNMEMVNSLKLQTFQRCASSLCHTYNYTRRRVFLSHPKDHPPPVASSCLTSIAYRRPNLNQAPKEPYWKQWLHFNCLYVLCSGAFLMK